MIFASNSPCKSYENEQNPYFSDFECNFRLLGGVFHKCSKSKYHRFRQNNFFGTHFSCEKHPLHVFCFFPPCMPIFFQKKLSSNSWGVKKAPCKNLYVFGENWQRNQFPKLTTLWLLFSLMLQLCHSALLRMYVFLWSSKQQFPILIFIFEIPLEWIVLLRHQLFQL